MHIEGQGHFFTIYFQALYVLCFTGPRYQVSVYRTIGPLVFMGGIIFVVVTLPPWSNMTECIKRNDIQEDR